MSLVDVLTAGTSRRDARGTGVPGLAGEILGGEIGGRDTLGSEIGGDEAAPSPELRLLYAAGAEAFEHKAGLLPRTDLAPPAAADADPRPACSPRAATLIEDMLAGSHEALLPEALDRVHLAGRRLPHRLLPLALGIRRTDVRTRLRPLLGPRGLWLAAQSPLFAWASEVTPSLEALARIWAEGTSAARRDALDRARTLDPAAARGWLATTWSTDKAEDRATFIGLLSRALSSADEPFLESALDDRSARVRTVAADLLARLPDSAFVARMRARADALLVMRGAQLEVTDPPAAPRDGLPEGKDLRGLRTTAVLAAASLDGFERRLGLTPPELIARALKSGDAATLADGWSRAALRARDPRWAEALWDLWADADDKILDRALASEHMAALIGVLPPAVAIARVGALLDRPGARAERPLGAFLVALPAPWPAALTDRYLSALLRAEAAVSPRASELMSALTHAVRAIAEADLPRAAALLPADGGDGPWRHALTEALDLIGIRREILEETRP